MNACLDDMVAIYDPFISIYPSAIEYANAVATAIETALDVAALDEELDDMLSLSVIELPVEKGTPFA